MQTTEIVKALRLCAIADCEKCDGAGYDDKVRCCTEALKLSAADRLDELLGRCARHAEEIAVLRERQRWIPVTERLPEDDGHYLCRYGFEGAKMAFYQTLDYYATDVQPHFQHEGMRRMHVTHWMPLPTAPEVEL